MNKIRTRATLIAAIAILPFTLSGCAPVLPAGYNGTITITSVIQSKYNCSIYGKASNGKTYGAQVGSAFNCFGLKKGMTLKVVNGSVRR